VQDRNKNDSRGQVDLGSKKCAVRLATCVCDNHGVRSTG
jgi:hypothetical protein